MDTNARKNLPALTIRDAMIVKRNFSGHAEEYNREGERYFTIRINDPEMANMLIADGWKIRAGKLRNPEDDPRWYMDVKVAFNEYYPMTIRAHAGETTTVIDESNIETLDHGRIMKADMVVRARYWEVNGKSGYKAYLKVLHVTYEEDDPFAGEYGAIPTEYGM